MLIIGLTGGIASGKTAVSDAFAALGVPIIDTDLLSRELVEPGQPALAEIVDRFGQDCLTTDGTLDRKHLRNIIFSDPQARTDLEAILHPRIRQTVHDRVNALDTAYCIVVIPLLVESKNQGKGMHDLFQRILVVDVPEQVQITRVMQRDNIDQTQAQAILATQASRAERLAGADDVIENTGSLEELNNKINKLNEAYLNIGRVDGA